MTDTELTRNDITRISLIHNGWEDIDSDYRVGCPHCGKAYRVNQRQHQINHLRKVHGLDHDTAGKLTDDFSAVMDNVI